MASDLERLGAAKYVRLSTFRKSGVPVHTPVWIARHDGELLVWSERTAGKVKRIRNNPKVELTECDTRGKKTFGATVSGTARILDDADKPRVQDAITGKYGLIGRVAMLASRLRGGSQRTVGLAITV